MQSDLVKVILNLAYMTPVQAKDFKFDKDFYIEAKKHMHHDNE